MKRTLLLLLLAGVGLTQTGLSQRRSPIRVPKFIGKPAVTRSLYERGGLLIFQDSAAVERNLLGGGGGSPNWGGIGGSLGAQTDLNTALNGRVLVAGSYSNPTWMTSLAWSKISTTPTTMAGYGIVDGVNSASNVGATGGRVFSAKAGTDLQFRRIIAGTNISVVENTNDITISATGAGGLSSGQVANQIADSLTANGTYFDASNFTGSGTNVAPINIVTDAAPASGSTKAVQSGGVFNSIGNKSSLTTTAKNTIVAAINEVKASLATAGGAPAFQGVLTALGSPILHQGVACNSTEISTANTLATGQQRYLALPVFKDSTTLSGGGYYQHTQGVFTANNENSVNLYSYSGGTLTRVATSGNVGTLYTAAANTVVQVAFTASIKVPPGVYFLGFLYSSSAFTTAPALGGAAGFVNTAAMQPLLTNSAKLYPLQNSLTASPSSVAMSTLSSGNLQRTWSFVY